MSNLKVKDDKSIPTFKDFILKNYREELMDIVNHGCTGGVYGLIYYNETIEVYNTYTDEIWEVLNNYLEEYGQYKSIPEWMGDDKNSIIDREHLFKNWLVWKAVEIVAYQLALNLNLIDY